jgi:hypothetical protein
MPAILPFRFPLSGVSTGAPCRAPMRAAEQAVLPAGKLTRKLALDISRKIHEKFDGRASVTTQHNYGRNLMKKSLALAVFTVLLGACFPIMQQQKH